MKTKLLLLLFTFSYALTYSQGEFEAHTPYLSADDTEDLSTWEQNGTEFNFVNGDAFYPASKNTNTGSISKTFNIPNSDLFLHTELDTSRSEKLKITSSKKIIVYIINCCLLGGGSGQILTNKDDLENISYPSFQIIKVNDFEYIIDLANLGNPGLLIVVNEEINEEIPVTLNLYKDDTTKDAYFKNLRTGLVGISEITLSNDVINNNKPELILNSNNEFELTNAEGNIEIYNNLGQQLENKNLKNGIYHIRVSSKNVVTHYNRYIY